MGAFTTPARDFRCDFIEEYVLNGNRLGIVWRHEKDEGFQWAIGDGSMKCGRSETIDNAKKSIVLEISKENFSA